MPRSRCNLSTFAYVMLAAFAVQAFWCSASAFSFRTIYSFCREADCADGGNPRGGLLQDRQGNLYGVTAGGGEGRGGTIFELVRTSKGGWKHKVLYSFCSVGICLDGAQPDAGLIADVSGNLYGTTPSGGKYDQGTVYELVPNAARTRWRLHTLHNFCPGGGATCPDGTFPTAPLAYAGSASGIPYDGVSPFYGTTAFGGTFAWGTVFRLTPPVSGKKVWPLKTLYNFCAQPNCADGAAPETALIVDGSGDLFGTTASGQNSGNNGVAFELVPNAQKTRWTETILRSFCSLGSCADGAFPGSGLVADGSGNFFGLAVGGGSGTPLCYASTLACGVAYKLTPNGSGWQEGVLYNFCSFHDCDDGYNPQGNIVIDPSGNVFGATPYGGGNDVQGTGIGGGTLFKLVASEGYFHFVLYSFCAKANCADGAQPLGNLIQDNSGNIFGMTAAGGASGIDAPGGTVFELTP